MSRERYEMVVGLEVHVQLKTRTKAFCGCSTDFSAPPNVNTCPVCLALPGALPVLNERAVELATRVALGLGCRVNPLSVFARPLMKVAMDHDLVSLRFRILQPAHKIAIVHGTAAVVVIRHHK